VMAPRVGVGGANPIRLESFLFALG